MILNNQYLLNYVFYRTIYNHLKWLYMDPRLSVKRFTNMRHLGHYTVWIGQYGLINDFGKFLHNYFNDSLIHFYNIFRLAIGSFVEEYNNKVQIVALDEEISEFSTKSTFDHPYPTTKIMWIPDNVCFCNILIVSISLNCYIFIL